MRRLLLIASMLLVMVVLIPVPSQAAWEQLDQASGPMTGNIGFTPTIPASQSFTANTSGELSRIRMQVGGDGHLTIEIRVTASDGTPTGDGAVGSGDVLASTTITSGNGSVAFTDITFTDPAQVTSGTTYSIVLIPQELWRINWGEGTHPGGQAWDCDPNGCWVKTISSVDDYFYVFETYVRPTDGTAPTGTVSINNDAAYTNDTAATLSLTCDDAISGCYEMALSTDGATFFSPPEAYASTKTVPLPPGDGVKTIHVRFIDEAGNESTVVSDAIVVDQTLPDTAINTNPPSLSNSTSAAFTFSGIDASGIADFQCSLDNELFTSCSSGVSYIDLLDGSHTFRVYSVDLAGNVDDSPDSWTWTIDTAAPTVTINQTSGQADPTNATSISFDVEFSEPVSDFDSTDVVVTGPTAPGVSIAPAGASQSFTVTVSGLSGTGTLTASIEANAAIDAALNLSLASTSDDNSVTYDLDAPTTTATVTGPQGQQDWYRSATVTLSTNEPATTTYTIDGGDSQTYSGPFSLTTDGFHTVTFVSIDAVGNTSPIGIRQVAVDGTAPVFQPLDDQTLDPTSPLGAPVTFTPQVTDNLSSAGFITASCADQFSTPFVSGQFAPSGTTTITCTATDLAGNTATESFTVTVNGIATLFITLDTLIDDLDLISSTERTLLTQAALAEMFANAGQPGMACMQLTSLDLSVRAQESRRRISRQDAAGIYAQTQQIRNVLGCGSSVG